MYSSNYDQPYPTSEGYPGSYDTQDSSAKLKERVKDPVLAVARWVKRRSPREKLILMGACAVLVSRVHVRFSAVSCGSSANTNDMLTMCYVLCVLQAILLLYLVCACQRSKTSAKLQSADTREMLCADLHAR